LAACCVSLILSVMGTAYTRPHGDGTRGPGAREAPAPARYT
jgi:hypothetical protein